jgi:serine phosphatase RsbU (regulator of sigma subunit)
LPLGVEPDRPRQETTHPAPPGTMILLYTDGLIERRDEHIDVGLRKLLEAVAVTDRCSAAEVVEAVSERERVDPPDDDVAVIAVRILT